MSPNGFDPRLLKGSPLAQTQPQQMVISAYPLSPRATIAMTLLAGDALGLFDGLAGAQTKERNAVFVREAFDLADLILAIEKEAGDKANGRPSPES